jgi:AcrR family transcriptional regulator
MRAPSDTSSPKRRVPQRERGERRVVELLDAAAAIIGEVGYDAATMTAIAERAGSSIGALYQYFPNKVAVGLALRSQYAAEMSERWTPLTENAAGLGTDALVEGIFVVMMDFIESRPAYLALIEAPLNYKGNPAARNRLREHFAEIYRKKQPSLSLEESVRVANVTFQVVKAMNPVYAEAKRKDRPDVLREFKLVVTAYLRARLDAG